MNPNEQKGDAKYTEIADFVKLLENITSFLEIGNDKIYPLKRFCKELTIELKENIKITPEQFLNAVRNISPSPSSKPENKVGTKKLSKEEIAALIAMPNRELADKISNNQYNKEDLLQIGNERFGLPRGTHRRLNKEQIRDKILQSIRNTQDLDIIGKVASD